MKAFLTWHDQPFRKTHDLIEIGMACTELEPQLESLLKSVSPLTEYAWKYRYPGPKDPPEDHQAAEAIKKALEIYNTILGRLPAEARPDGT